MSMKLSIVRAVVALAACEGKSPPKPMASEPAPPTLSVSPCKTDDECTVINTTPCNICSCAQTPIVKAEEARATAYFASVKCPVDDKNSVKQCAACQAAQARCDNGTCVAR